MIKGKVAVPLELLCDVYFP